MFGMLREILNISEYAVLRIAAVFSQLLILLTLFTIFKKIKTAFFMFLICIPTLITTTIIYIYIYICIYIYIYIYIYISSTGNNISKPLCPSGFLMYVSICVFVSLLARVVLCQSKCTAKMFC